MQTTETTTERKLVTKRERTLKGLPTKGLMLVVGHPKTAKTTFSADFPGSYVMELEKGGADRTEGRIDDIDNLQDFRSVLNLLAKDKTIKTVVIDTLDVLVDWMSDEIASARGLTKISERKAGVDGFEMWGELRGRLENLVEFIKNSDKLFILISHCKEPTIDKDNNVITPMSINVPGKGGAFILGQADMIGYAYKKPVGAETHYYLTFQGGPFGLWGSRVEELNDKTIRLPKKNPYSAFAALFEDKGGSK